MVNIAAQLVHEDFLHKSFISNRKLTIVALLAALSQTSGQATQDIACQYFITPYNEYACRIVGLTALNGSAIVNLTTQHMDGRTNANVDVLQIYDSNTPDIIRGLFEAFTNINEFDIRNSSLQRLEIPDVVRLEYLIMFLNNVTTITSTSLRNQTWLYFVDIEVNNIQVIEETAFETLEELSFLVLIDNNIQEIAPRTYANNSWLLWLDYEGNNLTRLEGGLFTGNPYLDVIFFERNQINAISPDFVRNLPTFWLEYINFSGNVCVDRAFLFGDDELLRLANSGLGVCFRRFAGNETAERNVNFRFSGTLVLSDEFGNEIGRFD